MIEGDGGERAYELGFFWGGSSSNYNVGFTCAREGSLELLDGAASLLDLSPFDFISIVLVEVILFYGEMPIRDNEIIFLLLIFHLVVFFIICLVVIDIFTLFFGELIFRVHIVINEVFVHLEGVSAGDYRTLLVEKGGIIPLGVLYYDALGSSLLWHEGSELLVEGGESLHRLDQQILGVKRFLTYKGANT